MLVLARVMLLMHPRFAEKAEREVVTTDLRRFFCVLRENNPLAGNFHTPRETLPATEDEIEDLLTTTDTAKRFPVKAPPATYDVSPRQRTGYVQRRIARG